MKLFAARQNSFEELQVPPSPTIKSHHVIKLFVTTWTSAFPDARLNVKKYFGKARPGRNAIKGLSIKSWINTTFQVKMKFKKKSQSFDLICIWNPKAEVVIFKKCKKKITIHSIMLMKGLMNQCSVAKWDGHYGGIFGTLCWRPCLKRTRERLFARRSRARPACVYSMKSRSGEWISSRMWLAIANSWQRCRSRIYLAAIFRGIAAEPLVRLKWSQKTFYRTS